MGKSGGSANGSGKTKGAPRGAFVDEKHLAE
jgi:hypothetical protein